MSNRHVTHSEEKHGLGIRSVVMARRAELEQRVAELQNSEQQGSEAELAIESSLAMLDTLLPTGDITPVITSQLVRWLEANKHLGVMDERRIHAVH